MTNHVNIKFKVDVAKKKIKKRRNRRNATLTIERPIIYRSLEPRSPRAWLEKSGQLQGWLPLLSVSEQRGEAVYGQETRANMEMIESTPQQLEESDTEMTGMASPQRDAREDEAGENAEGEGEGEGEEAGEDEEADEDERDTPTTPIEAEEGMTPIADNESEGGAQDTPSRPSSTTGRGGSSMLGRPPRRRRIGRPPKNKPADWDADEGTGTPTETGRTGTPDTPGARSGANTPIKRGRGRGRPYGGGAGGSGGGAAGGGIGRWGPKSRGSSAHVSHMPLDKDGNVLEVVDDEVALPEDPEGETKVDKLGNLLGGREFRVRTFKVLDRGERQYMLSTEPARCIGFRDSYLFFQKHRLLYKIIIDDEAKRDLIERDIIPHSYKGRAIGIVTARSVFREFGARIIIGGRKVVDDYHAQEARDRGDVEGELAVPEDRLPAAGEKYNKNQYVAWHGASSVYHSGVPSVPMPVSKTVESKKRRIVVTGDNWMVQHVREARYVSFSFSFCFINPIRLLTTFQVASTLSWRVYGEKTSKACMTYTPT